VQASVSNHHRVMMLLDFISDVQPALPEINDHQIISRTMQQRFLDFMFECSLSSFKINNLVWFRHDSYLAP
jgi:hypothetical protein